VKKSCKLPFLATSALAFSYAILALHKLQDFYNIPQEAPRAGVGRKISRASEISGMQRIEISCAREEAAIAPVNSAASEYPSCG